MDTNTNLTEQQTAKSFMSACRKYFGTKEGQSLRDFLAEVNSLSPEDKREIEEGLKREGIRIIA